ncbi:MAG: DUF4123 domain-containing protein, partial [Myxococcales bacterium]|nr:DUF4123 domain-containing protein [Myxococcales bacterium]
KRACARRPGARPLETWADEGRLFAVLDALGNDELPQQSRERGALRARCLYEGTRYQDLWAIGPHLWRLAAREVEPLLARAEEPWGYFVLCRAELPELADHLRTLLTCELPNGQKSCFGSTIRG